CARGYDYDWYFDVW
nr:immunoglobulin heavy chain junction region [Mus musculus]